MYSDEKDRIQRQASLDQRYGEIVRRHMDDPAYVVQNVGLFMRRYPSLIRILHHYEIFKMTQDVPGSIAEVGVFRGESLLMWAKFLEIFCMGDRTKTVYGFDHFEGLKNLRPEDGQRNNVMKEGAYNPSDSVADLRDLIALFDEDRFAPQKPRIKLVDGDVLESIPKWVEENPGVRLSLLHLDLDLYEPTLVALQHLYPLVVPGGLVVLDEYAFENFPGESRALEDYFKDKMPPLKKFDWSANPGAYFIKS
ncbi:MAG: TylF/MycF/NovP-related O-methyltransferase [Rhodospirillaceae bacterium]